jgi:riboflavin kinase/FMN adenylyltransferase
MRILEWDDFIAGVDGGPLSLSIGVFDGVHRGHQALIGRVCQAGPLSTVLSFRQNPLRALKPEAFPGDIFSPGQKAAALEALGLARLVLIDFSCKFSKLTGREFFGLLMRSCRIETLVLGHDFRCGCRLDTGIEEIARMAHEGTKILSVEPVMEGGSAVSSSRIRRAISAGDLREAALLLGRNVEFDLAGIPATPSGRDAISYNARDQRRVMPPAGKYRARIYGSVSGCLDSAVREGEVSIASGTIFVPTAAGGKEFMPERLEFLQA